MENKIKQFFTENLLLKIIGLLLAVLLWLVLSNMQDPVVSRSISVPITYDDSSLDAGNYVATSRPTTVLIPYKVRKSNVGKVKTDDFTVTVDMSEYLGGTISEAPETTKFALTIQKKQSATYIEDWEYPKAQGRYVEVVVDTIKTQSYRVDVEPQGQLPEGFQMGDLLISPQRVKVKGPTNEFANVAAVKATVDLSQITEETSSVTAQLHLYDGNNRMISNSTLELSQDTVEVTVGLKTSKQVAVSVDRYSGEPADGYACSSFDYEPKMVEVTGSKAALANISTIRIPKTGLDITGATENKSFEINLENYLPADISLADGQPSTVTIQFEIEKLEQKSFLIPTDTFQFVGTNDRYEYEILTPTVEIVLSSFAEELEAFKTTGGHLQGRINVTDMEPNGTTQFMPVLITIDSQYSLVQDIMVEIRITDRESSSEIGTENTERETGTAGEEQTVPTPTESETFGEQPAPEPSSSESMTDGADETDFVQPSESETGTGAEESTAASGTVESSKEAGS